MQHAGVVAGLPVHGGRILFNRPPRLHRFLSRTSVRVPDPPHKPAPPQSSVVSSLGIPLTSSLLMGSVYFLLSTQSSQSGGAALIMQVTAVAMMLTSSLPVIWMFFNERQEYRSKVRSQERKYRKQLAHVERLLESLRAEEKALRADLNPAPDELHARIAGRSPRLWERRPTDADFLHVRIGAGSLPSMVAIECGNAEEEYDLSEDAVSLAERFRRIDGVPITSALVDLVGLGIAGPREASFGLVRSILLQLATHHSPEEVRMVALLPELDIAEWGWLKWLPHTARIGAHDPAERLLAWNAHRVEQLATWLAAEMANRERAMVENKDPSARLPHLVVLIADVGLLRGQPALGQLFRKGKELGASAICLAGDPVSLPGECSAVLSWNRRESAVYALAGSEGGTADVSPDNVPTLEAEALARLLGPLKVVETAAQGQEEVPDRLGFLEMMNLSTMQDLRVEPLWSRSRTNFRDLLRAPIGLGAGGALQYIDLKDHGKGGLGPHGLVAGTTGSGKSELLRTLVAGLAAHHSPETLTFVLVDYKGGDAFGMLAELPHVVGLVTDLDPGLADRALVALRAELKRRERLMPDLQQCGASNLEDYQRLRGNRRPIPFLFIAVDEFAQLKSEMPQFIEGLIEVARVGRSLGVRLLLATQTPSGVVDDQIKKNSNYGICLRVRDAGDSREVIGRPEAAMLPGKIPGRAYLGVAGESIRLFQSAYVSGRYAPRTSDQEIVLRDFPPNAGQLAVGKRGGVSPPQGETRTELTVLVERLKDSALQAGVREPDRPWPEPLRLLVPFAELHPATGDDSTEYCWPPTPPVGSMAAPVGMLDEPASQRQGPFLLDLKHLRHLLIVGAPGSGKSTFLRTMALSLAALHTPDMLHIYCLDFGSRALKVLEELPHCGGVFLPVDTDRTKRLMRVLVSEVHRRKLLLSESDSSDLHHYNASRPPDPLPFLLVLLDNFPAFRDKAQEEERTLPAERTIPELVTLLRDGASLGIYFAITTTTFGAVSLAASSMIETRLALRQTDPSDYRLFAPFETLPGKLPAGRGFLSGTPALEFQTAIVADEAGGVKGVVERLSSSWSGERARVIEALPDHVRLERLIETVETIRPGGLEDKLVLGLDGDSVDPLFLDLGRTAQILVMGPAASGKSSLLVCCVVNLIRHGNRCPNEEAARVYVTCPARSPLRRLLSLGSVAGRARDISGLGSQLDELDALIRERLALSRSAEESEDVVTGFPPLVVIIDDYHILMQEDGFSPVSARLKELAKRGAPLGLRLIVAGLNSYLRNSNDYLIQYLFDARSALLLQPELDMDGQRLYGNLNRLGQVDMPQGRGYFITPEGVRLVQAAYPGEDILGWLGMPPVSETAYVETVVGTSTPR